MDSQRFDTLVRRLEEGRIGRRRFLWQAAALGLGMGGAQAGLAKAEEAEPGQTPGIGAEEPPPSTSQFPGGPYPQSPIDWICSPGPFNPWFPVIPSPELTKATGIAWYGLQLDEATGALTAAAFTRSGQEASRFESWSEAGARRWSIADGTTRLDGAVGVEAVEGGALRVAGTFGDRQYTLLADDRGTALESGERPGLDAAQEVLLAQWAPAAEELDGLLDILNLGGDGTVQHGTLQCAGAGFLAAYHCLNIFSQMVTGTDCYTGGKNLYEWGCE